jgi:hypothetical protein
MKNTKYLFLIAALNITFQLISDATAAKIIVLFGYGVSITVLYFPVTYIISDVLTEVYGYARARMVLWVTLICSVTAGLIYQLAAYWPAADFFEAADAYPAVFGIVPRVLVGGWLAVVMGDFANNYIMAKMKVLTRGRWLWTRTIGSTIVGQGVNTAVFYVVALYGVIPTDALLTAVVAGWVLKTAVEVLFTPVTYAVVGWLKRTEGVDVYDTDTDFNPFIFNARR